MNSHPVSPTSELKWDNTQYESEFEIDEGDDWGDDSIEEDVPEPDEIPQKPRPEGYLQFAENLQVLKDYNLMVFKENGVTPYSFFKNCYLVHLVNHKDSECNQIFERFCYEKKLGPIYLETAIAIVAEGRVRATRQIPATIPTTQAPGSLFDQFQSRPVRPPQTPATDHTIRPIHVPTDNSPLDPFNFVFAQGEVRPPTRTERCLKRIRTIAPLLILALGVTYAVFRANNKSGTIS